MSNLAAIALSLLFLEIIEKTISQGSDSLILFDSSESHPLRVCRPSHVSISRWNEETCVTCCFKISDPILDCYWMCRHTIRRQTNGVQGYKASYSSYRWHW